MFGLKFRYQDTTQNIHRAVDKAAYKNFGHAAASIRKDAQESIKKAPKVVAVKQNKSKRDKKGRFLKGSGKKRKSQRTVPSMPGTPPHTRRNQLKNAITYDANKDGAVIGPRYTKMGTAGEAHEFGGKYKDTNYPDRAYMGPALTRNQARLAGLWAGSI